MGYALFMTGNMISEKNSTQSFCFPFLLPVVISWCPSIEFRKKTDTARRKIWRLNKKRPLVQQGSKHADNRTRTCTVAQRHLKPPRLPIPPYPHKKCALRRTSAPGQQLLFCPIIKSRCCRCQALFRARDERGHTDRRYLFLLKSPCCKSAGMLNCR